MYNASAEKRFSRGYIANVEIIFLSLLEELIIE
jgi:hypothetical protein